ncbi:MAG: phosphonate ABC transporter ATP-binding protein [Campylobacterota bacterium]
METKPNPAFTLENVSVYFGKTQVIKDLSFSIAHGEKVAIIGPSGAGKTTVFRLLSGVLQPSSGEVAILGHCSRNLRKATLKKVRKDIGVLYQNDNLIMQLRVVHNVLMGKLGHWSLAKAVMSLLIPQQLHLAKEALQEVELQEKLWSMPGELSGGQQQRVALARLLVQSPKVMLADEPVSALDIRLGRQIIELLSDFSQKLSNTMIVNLHTLELLEGNFDRVIALQNGKLFWQGTPKEIDKELLFDLYGSEYKALEI